MLVSSNSGTYPSAALPASQEVGQPPSDGCLKLIGALGKVNMGGPAAKAVALALIGLGTASVCTGFGVLPGALLIAGGALLLVGSTETNIRNASTSGMYRESEMRVITYNAGIKRAEEIPVGWQQAIGDPEENYRAFQKQTEDSFVKLVKSNRADVILLQDIEGAGSLVAALEASGFGVYKKTGDKAHCAILLNLERFEVQRVIEADIIGHDTPFAFVKDKKNSQTMMFVTGDAAEVRPDGRARAGRQVNYVKELVPTMAELADQQAAKIRILGTGLDGDSETLTGPLDSLYDDGFEACHSDYTKLYPSRLMSRPELQQHDYLHFKVTNPPSSRVAELLGADPKVTRVVASTRVLSLQSVGNVGIDSFHKPVMADLSILLNSTRVPRDGGSV